MPGADSDRERGMGVRRCIIVKVFPRKRREDSADASVFRISYKPLPALFVLIFALTACGSDFDLLLEKEKISASTDDKTPAPAAPITVTTTDPESGTTTVTTTDPETGTTAITTTDPETGVTTVTTTDPETGVTTVTTTDPQTGTTTVTTTDPQDPDPDPDPDVPYIYWCESDGGVNCIPSDKSGAAMPLAASPGTPLDMAVDSADRVVYWAYNEGTKGFIYKAAAPGGSGTVAKLKMINNTTVTAIAVDPAESVVYFNGYSTKYGTAALYRSPLAAFSQVFLGNTTAARYIYALSFDGVSGRLYMTETPYYVNAVSYGTAGSGGAIGFIAASGGSPSLSESPSVERPYRGIAVDGANSSVYYVFNSGSSLDIIKADLSFGSPQTWIHAGSFDIHKIAVDLKDRKLYWTDQTSLRIYRADLDTKESNIEIFLALDSTPMAIAVAQ